MNMENCWGLRRGVLLLSMLASVPACENLRASALPEVPTWVNHPGGALDLVYWRDVTIENRRRGEAYERGKPAIDAAHRRVFVGSSDNGLYAIRAEDGSTIWCFETLGPVQSEVHYEPSDDSVYFGSNDGALYKVRASDGQLVWRFNSNATVLRKPLVSEGTVYFTNANDTLVALEVKTGKMLWNHHRTPAFGMEIGGYAGPSIWNGTVFTSFSDGVVGAFDAKSGAEKWPVVDLNAEAEQSGADAPKYLDADATPILDRLKASEAVFAASYGGGVFALDADSGARIWANDGVKGVTDLLLWSQPGHPPRDSGGPNIKERRVLVASSGLTGLWGLDPEDGRVLWRRKLPEGGMSAPTPIAGALLVSTTRYGVFLFSPLDGGVIDGIEPGVSFAMTPSAFGRRAFLLSNGGSLLSLHVSAPIDVHSAGTEARPFFEARR